MLNKLLSKSKKKKDLAASSGSTSSSGGASSTPSNGIGGGPSSLPNSPATPRKGASLGNEFKSNGTVGFLAFINDSEPPPEIQTQDPIVSAKLGRSATTIASSASSPSSISKESSSSNRRGATNHSSASVASPSSTTTTSGNKTELTGAVGFLAFLDADAPAPEVYSGDQVVDSARKRKSLSPNSSNAGITNQMLIMQQQQHHHHQHHQPQSSKPSNGSVGFLAYVGAAGPLSPRQQPPQPQQPHHHHHYTPSGSDTSASSNTKDSADPSIVIRGVSSSNDEESTESTDEGAAMPHRSTSFMLSEWAEIERAIKGERSRSSTASTGAAASSTNSLAVNPSTSESPLERVASCETRWRSNSTCLIETTASWRKLSMLGGDSLFESTELLLSDISDLDDSDCELSTARVTIDSPSLRPTSPNADALDQDVLSIETEAEQVMVSVRSTSSADDQTPRQRTDEDDSPSSSEIPADESQQLSEEATPRDLTSTKPTSQSVDSPKPDRRSVQVQREHYQVDRRAKKRFPSTELFLEYIRGSTLLSDELAKCELDNNCSRLFLNAENALLENGVMIASDKFRLVEALTNPTASNGEDFGDAIFMMYRNYWCPELMLDLLLFRYYQQPPDDCVSFSDLVAWGETYQTPVQKKVLEVLLRWIEGYYESDFKESFRNQEMMMNFIDLSLKEETPYAAEFTQLSVAMAPHLSKMLDDAPRQKKLRMRKSFKHSKKKSKVGFMQLHPVEVARQMTLIEYDLFRAMESSEFLNQNWSRAHKEEKAPNILRMIRRFNLTCRWIASEILVEGDPAGRAVLLARFIFIAEQCRLMRNYNGVMTVIAGLQQTPIWRLKHSWGLLPAKSWDMWESLTELMSSTENFGRYRRAIATAKSPAIPYLGLALTDLTMTDDGNSSLYPGTTLLNIQKLKREYTIITNMFKLRTQPFSFAVEPAAYEYLSRMQVLPEETLLKLSLRRERRKQSVSAAAATSVSNQTPS